MRNAFDPKAILRKNNLRATPGRIAILNVLAVARRPLTVAELHARVGSSMLDQVTLYRALETFVSINVARRIDLQQGRAHYYELLGEHHHHVICKQCGTVKDFAACQIDKIARQALKQVKDFTIINNHSFELFGLCNACTRMA